MEEKSVPGGKVARRARGQPKRGGKAKIQGAATKAGTTTFRTGQKEGRKRSTHVIGSNYLKKA